MQAGDRCLSNVLAQPLHRGQSEGNLIPVQDLQEANLQQEGWRKESPSLTASPRAYPHHAIYDPVGLCTSLPPPLQLVHNPSMVTPGLSPGNSPHSWATHSSPSVSWAPQLLSGPFYRQENGSWEMTGLLATLTMSSTEQGTSHCPEGAIHLPPSLLSPAQSQ